MYLLRRVSTFHFTNNGEAGGPPISKISDQNLSQFELALLNFYPREEFLRTLLTILFLEH